MQKYLIYAPAGKKFVAFTRSFSQQLLPYFPATTWKKKGVRGYLAFADFLGTVLPGISTSDNLQPFDVPLHDLIAPTQKSIELSDSIVMIMWNRDPKRQRAYIWLADRTGILGAFVKLGYGRDNRTQLANECAALKRIGALDLTFSVPITFDFFSKEDLTVFATSPLPVEKLSFDFVPWAVIKPHLDSLLVQTRQKITARRLCQASWFAELYNIIPRDLLLNFQEIVEKITIDVCLVHGDLGSENAFLHNKQLWIVDWERSSAHGPILTDRVGYWLGNTCEMFGLNEVLLNSFEKEFLDSNLFSILDSFLAVSYLASMNFPPAVFLLTSWVETNFLADMIFAQIKQMTID